MDRPFGNSRARNITIENSPDRRAKGVSDSQYTVLYNLQYTIFNLVASGLVDCCIRFLESPGGPSPGGSSAWSGSVWPGLAWIGPELLGPPLGPPPTITFTKQNQCFHYFARFCSLLLHFASMLVPRAILVAVVACWALFLEPFWSVVLSIRLLFSGCVCFGFQANRLVYETRHSLNSPKPLRTRWPMV